MVFEYNIHIMNNLSKFRIESVILSAFTLLTGLSIYLFLRVNTYIHDSLPYLLNQFLFDFYNKVEKTAFIDFLRFYFVDFLWCISLSFALCAIVSNLSVQSVTLITVFTFILGTIFEIFQLLSVIHGTFDITDICMYAAASLLCAAINIKIIKRRKLWTN